MTRDVPQLTPLLAARRSPTRFDRSHTIDASTVDVLLEAARWAPSAGNSQPWAFVVACRGDDTHTRLTPHLRGAARQYAPTAGLLLANLAHHRVEGTDWEFSEFALYDLGQAVAHLTVQAAALGLSVRQFRSFDREAITAEFAVPPHWQVTTMAAVGRALDGRPPSAEAGIRSRHPHHELRWPAGRRKGEHG